MVNRMFFTSFLLAELLLAIALTKGAQGVSHDHLTESQQTHNSNQHTVQQSMTSTQNAQNHTNNSAHPKPCSYGFYGKNCEHECGLTSFETDLRIVGGIEAIPHSWPAQVFIEGIYYTDFSVPDAINGSTTSSESNSTNDSFFDDKAFEAFSCGGTLIRPNVVLTAGHCILEKVTKTVNNETYEIKATPNQYFPNLTDIYKIYLGYHNVSTALNGNGTTNDRMTQIRSVKQIIRHPDFNGDTLQNDLALLILNQDAEINQEVQVACLPSPSSKKYPNSNPNIKNVYAVGWGLLNETDKDTPDDLYNVKLNLYDGSYCDNELTFNPKNWDSQICAGNYLGGQDTCSGDSGGGLYVLDTVKMHNVKKQKFVVAGVVSYGDGCARSQEPGIYTRVSYYLEWILKQIKRFG